MSDKDLKRLLNPKYDLFFLIMLLVSAVGFFYHGIIVGSGGMVIAVIMWVLYRFTLEKKSRRIRHYIENISMEINSAGALAVADFPLPLAVVQNDTGEILWSNEHFNILASKFRAIDHLSVCDVFEGFAEEMLHVLVTGGSRDITVRLEAVSYRVFSQISRTPGYGHVSSLSFVDISHEARIEEELQMVRPVVALIQVDNYEELVRELSSYESTFMMASIESCINSFAEKVRGIVIRNDERYTMIFEKRYLELCVQSRFAVLDAVREVKNPSGMSATLSIGIGNDYAAYLENLKDARLAMDMALSRGGDQAVIKNRMNYAFFGGGTREIERRTKVRSRVIASAVADLVRSSSHIIAMGHKYSDMDSLGACAGVVCFCRKLGIPAYIVFDSRTTSAQVLYEKLASLSEYKDVFISAERAMELMSDKALLVITDVSRPSTVDAPQVLATASRIVVIDHHRRAADYIDNAMVSFHEPYASSASELVSEMMQYVLTHGDLLRQEAECMLAGIMLDTKNFTMKTGVRTFEAAAFLRRAGADTIEVKRLFSDRMEDYFDRCDIIKTAEKYRTDIAIAYSEKEVLRAIAAQAADGLLNVEGVQGSFVVFRFNGATHISGRSLGKINVQVILEQMGGGGSLMEAGAQPGDRPVQEVIAELKSVINVYYSTM